MLFGLFLVIFLIALIVSVCLRSEAPTVTIHAGDPYMSQAIGEALYGISHKHGGPFGTVIVRNGKIVGRGHNMVLKNDDPTAHGEVSAIRDAGRRLRTHDLSDCELYTTGEPCPMCLYACLWANVKRVHYGCTIGDNSRIGFRDEAFDKLGGGREALADYLECVDRDACLELFEYYKGLEHDRY